MAIEIVWKISIISELTKCADKIRSFLCYYPKPPPPPPPHTHTKSTPKTTLSSNVQIILLFFDWKNRGNSRLCQHFYKFFKLSFISADPFTTIYRSFLMFVDPPTVVCIFASYLQTQSQSFPMLISFFLTLSLSFSRWVS